MKTNLNEIIIKLQEMSDSKLSSFHQGLIPNATNILGIPTDKLRKYAKELCNNLTVEQVLKLMEDMKNRIHEYQELDYLYSFLICYIKISTSKRIELLNEYSYTISNWATCDMAVIKTTFKEKDLIYLLELIKQMIKTYKEYPYRARLGFVLLKMYYINDEYFDEIISLIESVDTQEYYLEMGIAWLISEMIIKKYDQTIKYLRNQKKLSEFVYQKSLQKAVESKRLKEWQKEKCRELKRGVI